MLTSYQDSQEAFEQRIFLSSAIIYLQWHIMFPLSLYSTFAKKLPWYHFGLEAFFPNHFKIMLLPPLVFWHNVLLFELSSLFFVPLGTLLLETDMRYKLFYNYIHCNKEPLSKSSSSPPVIWFKYYSLNFISAVSY